MKIFLVFSAIISVSQACLGGKSSSKEGTSSETYRFPDESDKHEGTWLEWPHGRQYGEEYRKSIEISWIEMTKALQGKENVHIIAYDEDEKKRITDVLKEKGFTLDGIDFRIYRNDDVWARDNGPIFVKDSEDRLLIEDWGFNGWGGKHDYKDSDKVPSLIGKDLGVKVIDVPMVNEGGSVESDGHGVLMACRSSVISQDSTAKAVRNKGMTEEQADKIFIKYYGLKKVIWLDGRINWDITDFHVDGFMKFVNNKTMITMSNDDLSEWGLSEKDIKTLNTATNADGQEYKKVIIPLTKNKVVLSNGTEYKFQGSYANYYVANGVVLVPNYKDPHDDVANKIIQEQYPERKVIGIDVRDLYSNGGMIHCVTQQQPAGKLYKL